MGREVQEYYYHSFSVNAAGSELEKSVASERAVPDDPVLDG